jgi:predicted O-linked N-acetylglucosamine transferase (SPINDLY family)
MENTEYLFYFRAGVTAYRLGALSQAKAMLHKALQIQPRNFEALNLLGFVAYQLGEFDTAADAFGQSIAIEENAEVCCNRGNALTMLSRHAEALDSYDKAIALQPNYAFSHIGRGNALSALGMHEQALPSYERAIALAPEFPMGHYNLGRLLGEIGRLPEALACFDKAISLNPNYVEALDYRGIILLAMNQFKPALESHDRAIALQPGSAYSHINRANTLVSLRQYGAAIASYERGIAIKPDIAAAYCSLAATFENLKQYELAIENYEKAIAIHPHDDVVHEALLHAKMSICDWIDFENQLNELSQKIKCGKKASGGHPLLSLNGSLALQRKAVENVVHIADQGIGGIPKRAPGHRIRLGYFSADFHAHATTALTAELFEWHDRQKFELIAFSFGPNIQDEMRQRVATAFDQFHDVETQSDREVALLSRSLGIDIAVDLKGFTRDSRVGIFASRAAPIQVNYLGYPGTMGAGFIDYLIADRTLIPEQSRRHYSEKIVYLPNSYQVNAKRKISERVFSRKDLGLPPDGFVFCCFNGNYKITPRTFDGWMRILKKVNGSVLWLLGDNPTATGNLRKEAQNRGVDPDRLVFAERMPLPEHLARHQAADLFIDTLPCNAHTTASDALWAGLPVLTLSGEALAGRVAASLLTAMDMPGLIASTQEEFEGLAVALASNPGRLKAIRQELERKRLTTPLFDSQLFAKHLEDAYSRMVERYQADMPPADIFIAP